MSTGTGSKRRKTTRMRVKLSDALARMIIRIGGIGTIGTVSLVGVLLVVVVAPLYFEASIEPKGFNSLETKEIPLETVFDEYRTISWSLFADGNLQVRRTDTLELLSEQNLTNGKTITSSTFELESDELVLGMEDGSALLGSIGFKTSFLNEDQIEQEYLQLQENQIATYEKGTVQITPQGQFRIQKLNVNLSQPLQLSPQAITHLDAILPLNDGGAGRKAKKLVFIDAAGRAQIGNVIENANMFTGEVELKFEGVDLPLSNNRTTTPDYLRFYGIGDRVYLIWKDGELHRFDTRNTKSGIPSPVIEDLLPDHSLHITALEFSLGNATLIVGDSGGNLAGWLQTRSKDGQAGDFFQLVHQLPKGQSSITSLGFSSRSRMISAGYADGTLKVFHVTTDQEIFSTQIGSGREILKTFITPKEDGLVAITEDSLWHGDFDPKHPEASIASLFGPVWYEGYDEPKHIWQSSFANSAPEVKLGLRPLIFGTLKATFYTMLFGTPIALLGAIYTSEFLGPRSKAFIKPSVEMMASLPSVVLGFMAGLVLAPFVEYIIPQMLACVFLIPGAFLLGGHLWQLLPRDWQLKYANRRFWLIFITIPVAMWISYLLGPQIEEFLFSGDIRSWLENHDQGNGIGAWMILWLPLSVLIVGFLFATVVTPKVRTGAHKHSRIQFGSLALMRFLLASLAVLLIAYVISATLDGIGWDPRGTYVDRYDQRNAFVVGFVMGFAVIPIIYTIAEDALSTVPNHLRSGSYGTGATTWQTTVRIVIPTAMSGLFSAVMVGLGRAVGETMIVLMAGGNTSVEDWNMFNGFRTLSANIAVELPEAVRNSTHYRTLFLAALTLFVLTFVVNTIAELVRLRFRKRAYQL